MPRTLRYIFTALSCFMLLALTPTCIALAQTAPYCSDQNFIGPRAYDTLGGNAQGIATGDLNGDGKQDMVLGKYYTSDKLVLFLGDGDGGFEAAREIPDAANPQAIIIADFDGDGRQDLATVNGSFPGVSILLGDGTGGFSTPHMLRAGSIPSSLVAGDFNGDGRLDLAVSNFGSTSVSILLGDGTGNFGTPTSFPTGTGPQSIATGDFNGDGKIDLVVANYNSASVYFLFGDGTGAFPTPLNVPVDAHPMSLAVADFNRDGKQDVAVVGQSNTLTILQGNGAGAFTMGAHLTVGSSPSDSNFISVADFDVDGKLDVAVANYNSSTVAILKGDGAGGFGAVVNYPGAYIPNSLAPADFNGDGRPDLAVVNSQNVMVLLSNSSGGFISPTLYPTHGLFAPPILSDFNGDGIVDLAMSNFNDQSISILLGNSSGGFAPITDYPAVVKPAFLAAADFNGDGKTDLALTSFTANTVSLLLNNGSGGFGPPTTIISLTEPYHIVAADFNGDGKADLAVADASTINDRSLKVLMGKGDGSFQTPLAVPVESGGGYFVVAFDFNRDGKSDLALADSVQVRILIANATGGFNPPVDYKTYSADGTPSQSIHISVGDINGDGKEDLVVIIAGDTVYLLGNGNGTFSAPKNIGFGGDATLIADFNNDGKQDLALDKRGGIQIVYGDGTGKFVAHEGGYFVGTPLSILDMNKDGRLDIMAYASPNGVFVLTNVCGEGDGPTGYPIDEPGFFVRQHYYDFLSRTPDLGGIGYWTSQLNICAPTDAACLHNRRLDVSNAFFYEQEFQSTGAYVYRVYKAAFGARPTFAQFLPDRGLVIGGPQLDASKSAYALAFVQRASFLQLYPRTLSANAFLDALFNNIKQNSGVDLSSLRSQLIALYDGTDKGRAAIIRQLADNQALIDAEYNRSFVLMEYFGYLRRDPDQGGYDFWLAQVNKFPIRNVEIQHAMVCSFITSAEYQLRFSSIVTHTNRECPQ